METLRAIAEGALFALIMAVWVYSSMGLAVAFG